MKTTNSSQETKKFPKFMSYNNSTGKKQPVLQGYIIDNIFFTGRGSIQCGRRPCVVVSNNICNQNSPVIHVVPLSTNIKRMEMPVHKYIKANTYNKLLLDSVALCEQVMPISSVEAKDSVIIGILTPEQLMGVLQGISVQFASL